ncbi:MAG: hypothetical protein IVW55_14525 [Chloroflexi bacterium]|nr:hypothetical protein [Chloroflexota bacterium]
MNTDPNPFRNSPDADRSDSTTEAASTDTQDFAEDTGIEVADDDSVDDAGSAAASMLDMPEMAVDSTTSGGSNIEANTPPGVSDLPM